MDKPETLEEYYANRPFLKSIDLSHEEGHFNVLRIGDHVDDDKNNVVYGRKDYFKICLVNGKSKIHYADKSFEILEHGLLFTSPLIPYNWEVLGSTQTGYSCIFSESFFTNYGDLKKYPFFTPNGYPVFELKKSEAVRLEKIFSQMTDEKKSDFEFKDNALRNLTIQLIHDALKMRPTKKISHDRVNAANRITSLFYELLESQYPIRNTIDGIKLRTASDFANQMAIHVNHLNKSIKSITQKTTSELITDRLLKEARIMLRHSTWAISEIAYNLGFDGPSHFSNFFKKKLKITPSEYRNF
ncbi:helix-turn-helix transcriptional regulator [Seonamhaeicola sp.]|uniref:helix-turn-helix domain-containing protein n=1 Tax=Seonamhaeicola sp. TaxID=1912245 RepID=UPI00261E524C|nr:helix-turn-helix transcriptional regulator [Seonamhaeicola sp.]